MFLFLILLILLPAIGIVRMVSLKTYRRHKAVFLLLIALLFCSVLLQFFCYLLFYHTALIFPFLSVLSAVFFILFGLLIGFPGFYHICSLIRCKTVVPAKYLGYRSGFGGKGSCLSFPVFEYNYNGQHYCVQSKHSEPYRLLRNKREGELYTVYLDKNHPKNFLLQRRISCTDIISLLLGILLCFGFLL